MVLASVSASAELMLTGSAAEACGALSMVPSRPASMRECNWPRALFVNTLMVESLLRRI